MAKLPTNPQQVRMSFGEHLEELRKRIMYALFGSVGFIVVCLIYYKEIVHIVSRPYILAAQAHNLPAVFNTLKPQEAFLTSVTLAFQAGLILASPWIIFQLWQFVAAGLFPRERKIVYRYLVPTSLLFLAGVAFFYLIVLPMVLHFFMSFTVDTAGSTPTPTWIERAMGIAPPPLSPSTAPAVSSSAQPATLPVLDFDPPRPEGNQAFIFFDSRDGRIKVLTRDTTYSVNVFPEGSLFSTQWRYDDYLSFVMFTALVFGLAFELPLVVMILARIGLVQVQTFRRIRKYAYFAIVVISAIAAPSGDLMTLAFLSIPLIVLYELGILAATFTRQRQV
ncbi:MAG: twin-arginine translocase subunit TatC [Phycisphaerales bacterium]|nr:twin-arginine translocase subunit TatC [Phycisphaerales bacterium]